MRRLSTSAMTAIVAALLTGCAGGGGPAPTTGPAGPSPADRAQVGTWSALPDLPQARSEFSAAVLDGMIYVGGGFAQGPGADAFFRYDPGTQTWSELAPLPERRHHAPLAAYDGSVYVIAGYAFEGSEVSLLGRPTDTLFVYDVATDTWREGPPLPQALAAHAVATTDDGMIHVIGGISEESDRIRARDEHLVFDPRSETWSSLAPMPSSREHLGAAYLDGVVYAAAGRTGGDGVAFEAYDVASGQWTVLPPVPTSRSGVAVVAFDGQIFVLGGETLVRTFDEVERYDPRSGTWQEVSPMRSARHGLAGVALDDGIVVIAGGPTVGLSYSRATEIWRP